MTCATMSDTITACKSQEPAATHWYLAYTKPRCEHTASAQLARQGYAVYLPLYKTLVRTAEGMAVRHGPMFPRYVFFRPGSAGQSIAPVRSSVAVGAVCPPISRGFLYCRSAVEKWLVAAQATSPA